MNKKFIGILIQVLCWGIVLGMPLMMGGPARHETFTWAEYVRNLAMPLSMLVVFYINFFELIDKALFRHRFVFFFGLNILIIAFLSVGMHFWFEWFDSRQIIDFRGPHRGPMPFMPIGFMLRNAAILCLISALSVAIRMTQNNFALREAELQHLKNQLNPHFLFNSLNSIYALIEIDPGKAQEALHGFSRLLRHALYDNDQPYVSLRSEIDFMKHYVELMTLRLPAHAQATCVMPEDTPESIKVAPMLFISLIENAFKHGISATKPSSISIELTLDVRSKLTCTVRNTCFPKTEEDKSGSGIGIKNLRQRLELIYPQRYSFSYGPDNEGYYAAVLSVQL